MTGKQRFPCAFNKKLVPSAKTIAKKIKNFDSSKKKNKEDERKGLNPDKLIALNDAAEEKTAKPGLTALNSSMKARLKFVFDDASSDDDSKCENEENKPELVERMKRATKKRNEELTRTDVSIWNTAASTSPLHEKIDENLAEISHSSLTMSIPEQSEPQPSKHNVGSSQVKEDLPSSAVGSNNVFESNSESQKYFVNCSKPCRKGPSLVWKYFGHLRNEGGEIVDNEHYYCSKCFESNKCVKFKCKSETSNILTHLRNHHSIGGAVKAAPSQVYTCDLCSETFIGKPKIEFHMQHVHIAAKSSASDSSDFKVICHLNGKKTRLLLWNVFGTLVHPDGSDVEDQANFYHCKLCVEGSKILKYRYQRSTTAKNFVVFDTGW